MQNNKPKSETLRAFNELMGTHVREIYRLYSNEMVRDPEKAMDSDIMISRVGVDEFIRISKRLKEVWHLTYTEYRKINGHDDKPSPKLLTLHSLPYVTRADRGDAFFMCNGILASAPLNSDGTIDLLSLIPVEDWEGDEVMSKDDQQMIINMLNRK